MFKKILLTLFISGFIYFVASASDTLYIYGPGGPYGPMNEAATAFSIKNNIPIKVVAGPEPNWINAAKQNADIFFGGAEYTAAAIKKWKEDPSMDVWINYASWHYRLTDITELVPIRKKKNIFLGTPVAISKITNQEKDAGLFIQFLKSNEGHTIFQKWGWE